MRNFLRKLAEPKMSSEKILYLHIGCGKTGSSALQVWLNHQAETLRKLGVHYPVYTGNNKLDAYAITSGNGVKLLQASQAGQLAPFVEELAQTQSSRILLSSETFQSFTPDTLQALKEVVAAHGFRITVIAYVRDVYDVAYSLYLQSIKRHLEHRPFKEIGMRATGVQQFDVVQKYRQCFGDENIRVFHYDTERTRGLDLSMCDAIGIPAASIPRMAPLKVNRSLDVFEAELMRLANRNYVQAFARPKGVALFSTRISDHLIYGDPERETEILLDAEVLEHLRSVCQPAIDDLNRVFLRRTPLALFNADGKRIVREVPVLPPAYKTIVQGLVNFFASDEAPAATPGGRAEGARPRPQRGPQVQAENKPAAPAAPAPAAAAAAAAASTARRPNAAPGEALESGDPRVVNALRDEAIRIEKSDLPRALVLMTAAAALRPNGAGIKKKLEEYHSLIH